MDRQIAAAVASPFGYRTPAQPADAPCSGINPRHGTRVLVMGLLGVVVMPAAAWAWVLGARGRKMAIRAGRQPDLRITAGWALGWLATLGWTFVMAIFIGLMVLSVVGRVAEFSLVMADALPAKAAMATLDSLARTPPTSRQNSRKQSAAKRMPLPIEVTFDAIDQATRAADKAHVALTDAAHQDWTAFETSAATAYVDLYTSLITVAEYDPHLLAKGSEDPMVASSVNQSLTLIGELNSVRVSGAARHPSQAPIVRAIRSRLERLTNGLPMVDEDLSEEY